MKSRRTKALEIPPKVKRLVFERDGCCILCGSNQGQPVAHYIARSQGGLGVEQNIVTLCHECHRRYDNTADRPHLREMIAAYLKGKYEDWDEKNLYYRKDMNA